MKIRFLCPGCQRPSRLVTPAETWQCPACDQLIQATAVAEGPLATCVLCGNSELYMKKNFPHWLGLTILAGACLAFLLGHKLYQPWAAWAVLLGSAAFDGLLYLWVGDASVCYRCGAHYSGLAPQPDHKPFDLGVAERYRQERLRREQLEAQKRARG